MFWQKLRHLWRRRDFRKILGVRVATQAADGTLQVGMASYVLLSPCLLYTSPSPRDGLLSRMPSSA